MTGLFSSKSVSIDEHPISYDSVKLVQGRGSGILNLGSAGVREGGLHKNQCREEK